MRKPGDLDRSSFCATPQKPEHLEEEICALDSSKEQLLKEGEARAEGGPQLHQPALPCSLLFLSVEKLIEVKLEDVKHRLSTLCGPEGSSNLTEGLFLRSHEAAAAM